jgi:hypothetical protein
MKVKVFFILSLILFGGGLLSCKSLSFKSKDPYTKEEKRLFSDKDLYLIDGHYYLKVREKGTGKENFVEIRDFLKNPERWEIVKFEREKKREEKAKESAVKETKRIERPLLSLLPQAPFYLKKKILILPFEVVGESFIYQRPFVEELFSRVFAQKALRVIPVFYKGEWQSEDLSQALQVVRLGDNYGTQALLWVRLYGPFRSAKSFFALLDFKLYETLEGKVMFEGLLQKKAQSPEEALQGLFEDLVVKTEEILGSWGWFIRVVKVQDGKGLILAGERSGLRKGDLLEVKDQLPKEGFKARVSELLGEDMAKLEPVEDKGLRPYALVIFTGQME